jgi:hypothetical protein
MKKIIASLIVFGFALTMVACGGKKEESAATADTTAVETPAAEHPAADTTAAEHPADSTAAH